MKPPLFNFTDTFDSEITVGDKTVPIHIRRGSRADVEAMERLWAVLMVPPRGVAPAQVCEKCASTDKALTDAAEARRIAEWEEANANDRVKFWEGLVTDYVTLDEGLIQDRGNAVTTGAGLVSVFHSRKDVLRVLALEIYLANHLVGVMAKNSNSLRASDTGSASRIPARSGDGQGSTVENAESSSSAENGDVTDDPDGSETAAAGEPDGATKVH